MTDIPADIQAAAREAAHAFLRDDQTPLGVKMMLMDTSSLRKAIADELVAERKRCAAVGREAALYAGCPADFIAEEISAAILAGMHPTEADELNEIASQWIEVTYLGAAYQHMVNADGRERWRRRAAPDDVGPPPWNPGKPPAK